MSNPDTITLVIDSDGELSVIGLPMGWRLECLDFEWGEQERASFEGGWKPEKNPSLEETRDGAPFMRYDIPEGTFTPPE